MNIEFDPEQMNFPKEPKRHVTRPYLLLGAYLLFLALLLLIPGLMPPGANPGTGSGISGKGGGAGGEGGESGSSAMIPADGPGSEVETGPKPSIAGSTVPGNSKQAAGVAGGQAASAEIVLSPRPVRWDNLEPQRPAAASQKLKAELQKSMEQLYVPAKINPKSSTGTYHVAAFSEGTTDFPNGPASAFRIYRVCRS